MEKKIVDFLSENWYEILAGFLIGLSFSFCFLKLIGLIFWSWFVICLPIVILLILSIGLICYMGYILNKFDTLNDEW